MSQNFDASPDPASIDDACRRNRIRRLALFGSRMHGTAREGSDVDLLVEFEAGATPGLLKLVGIANEFSHIFGGLAVDLRTERDLSRYFRSEVLASAKVLYGS